jgi:hypothetical protein
LKRSGPGRYWPPTLCADGYERGLSRMTIARRRPLNGNRLAGKATTRSPAPGEDRKRSLAGGHPSHKQSGAAPAKPARRKAAAAVLAQILDACTRANRR